MVSLDVAIVNVALPSIQSELQVASSDLQWVVITYGLVFGGLLLLGGRLGDMLGHRRTLLVGLVLFTLASLTAGIAGSFAVLVASRAAQGVGAALVAPAALAILAGTFTEGPARTKALGIFGAAGGSAASIGVVLSGALTAGPGWEWIFFINVPVGVLLVSAIVRFIPRDQLEAAGRADVGGAVCVTAGLMSIVYAVNKSVDHGWGSATVLSFLTGGLISLALFVLVERSSSAPLMPLAMFRRSTLNAANLVAALAFGAFFATIFQASLFMQQVLDYSAIRTGVAYLAMAGTAVALAAGPAPLLVTRLGGSRTLVLGQVASAAGLVLLAQVPADAAYWTDLFPGFALVGGGIGLSIVAVQVTAFLGIPTEVSGLAGGMIETSKEIGGALGTAIIASVAIASANGVLDDGAPVAAALTEGFKDAALVAVGLNLAAALAAVVVLRRAERMSLNVVESVAAEAARES